MPPPGRNSRRQIRREIPRIPGAFNAGKRRGTGYVSKISRKGLFFSTEDLPRPGDAVRIVFEDGDGNKIDVEGHVRWNTDQLNKALCGFGVELDCPSEAFLEFYDQLLT